MRMVTTITFVYSYLKCKLVQPPLKQSHGFLWNKNTLLTCDPEPWKMHKASPCTFGETVPLCPNVETTNTPLIRWVSGASWQ